MGLWDGDEQLKPLCAPASLRLLHICQDGNLWVRCRHSVAVPTRQASQHDHHDISPLPELKRALHLSPRCSVGLKIDYNPKLTLPHCAGCRMVACSDRTSGWTPRQLSTSRSK